jgi:hypothetical protein
MFTTLLAASLSVLYQEDVPDWAALARADIETMHALTAAHHPGPVDADNPDFLINSEAALTRGLALADQVEDQVGFAYALRAYAAAYRDGHYGVGSQRGDAPFSWPGLIVKRLGGVWQVTTTDAAHTELEGAEIVQCDDRTPDDWMREVVFGFASNPALNSAWVRRSPQTFLDNSNPFAARPERCEFRLDGHNIEQALVWSEIAPADWSAARSQSDETREFALRDFGANRFWVSVPTFGPRDEQVEVMQNLIAALGERAEELRSAEAIVFDVRGNNGGSSSWGDDIIRAVWGEDYAAWRRPAPSAGVDYRISDGNIEHAEYIVQLTVDQNMTEAETYFREVLAGMQAAREAGQDFYVEVNEAEVPAPEASNPVTAQVFFLTDGSCGSACLDFADRMLALEGVVHIGGETGADSDYMELRQIDLPSGHARIALPIKVYRGRPRASGQTYVPTLPYEDRDPSTAAMEAWINGLIDN